MRSVIIAFAVLMFSAASIADAQTVSHGPGDQSVLAPPSLLPADPHATDAAREVLYYLQNIILRSDHNLISGQLAGNCCSTDSNCCRPLLSDPTQTGTQVWIDALPSDQKPGLVGFSYYEVGSNAPPLPAGKFDLITNAIANTTNGYWTKTDQLIEISWPPENPWTTTAMKQGQLHDTTCKGKLTDLITDDPGHPHSDHQKVYMQWQSQLAAVAKALADLQDNGVAVIWRPFAEESGFWYGSCKPTNAEFTAVWANMFNYFGTYVNPDPPHNARNIHNLLWDFSPAADAYTFGKPNASPLSLLPDNKCGVLNNGPCTDIVSIDNYSDDNFSSTYHPNTSLFPHYGDYVATGKVVTFGERGHSTIFQDVNSQVQQSYPRVVLFQAFADGAVPDTTTLPVSNCNLPPSQHCNSIVASETTSHTYPVLDNMLTANQPHVQAVMHCLKGLTWAMASDHDKMDCVTGPP